MRALKIAALGTLAICALVGLMGLYARLLYWLFDGSINGLLIGIPIIVFMTIYFGARADARRNKASHPMSNRDELLALAERAEAVAVQGEAALRHVRGLPLLPAVSDTHPDQLALWADNGLAGCGQVALMTGEFPADQAKGIAALVNNMAGLLPYLPSIAASLRACAAMQGEGSR